MTLQDTINDAIAGDTITVSGLHTLDVIVSVSGTSTDPITIRGNGTAEIRSPGGNTGNGYAMQITGDYIHVDNIVMGTAAKACVVESANHIAITDCTFEDTRTEAFKVRGDSSYVWVRNCISQDAGLGASFGEGFYVGESSGNWPTPNLVPDVCHHVQFDGCIVRRCYGDGFDFKEGSHHVKAMNSSVDFSLGNAPPLAAAGGDDGTFSRADFVQMIGVDILSPVADGFRMFDVTVDSIIYGRNQEVKGGSAHNAGGAGVASQSEGMKVYSDFVATGTVDGRILVVGGGWSGTSDLDPGTFVEMDWSAESPAYAWAYAETPPPVADPSGAFFAFFPDRVVV